MMAVLVLLVSRVVVLLFLLSATLIVARFLHDRCVGRSRRIGIVVFGVVLGVGVAAVSPYAIRSGVVCIAEYSYSSSDWQSCAHYFEIYHQLGGHPSRLLGQDWAEALMNIRRFREAEDVLVRTNTRRDGIVAMDPHTVCLIGMCRYYQGHLRGAFDALKVVPGGPDAHLREYFLGRIEDRAGRTARAGDRYAASLVHLPDFMPARFHLIRILLASGERAAAVKALRILERGSKADFDQPVLGALRDAVAGRTVLSADMEFFLVQIGR